MTKPNLIRDPENIEKANFLGVGAFDIPPIYPEYSLTDEPIEKWVSFSQVNTAKDSENCGLHFFLYDYQFTRLWRMPMRYIPILQRYKAVLSPDFSLYTDYPIALQLYNHYRKHWLAALWQDHDITVIPTICWSTPESYEWCFDGEPINAPVAVSSVGTQNDDEAKELFLLGYSAMMERLHPSKIIFFGDVPAGCDGNIIHVPTYYEDLRRRTEDGRTRRKIK